MEKILVVDDEREIADLIEVYLQNENYVQILHGGGCLVLHRNTGT